MRSSARIRIITSRAYHALFMHNMLIRPTAEELANFGTPASLICFSNFVTGFLVSGLRVQPACM